MKFLDASDFLAVKRLSKRCFTITFLNQRLRYVKQLVDSNLYYSNLSFFVRKLLENVKDDIDLSNWLFLNYILDNLKTDLMISNCFCHLFHCPRSFAKSQCSLCSRNYVLTRISKPKNFEEFKFDFRDRSNFKEISSLSFDVEESNYYYCYCDSDNRAICSLCEFCQFLSVFVRKFVN